MISATIATPHRRARLLLAAVVLALVATLTPASRADAAQSLAELRAEALFVDLINDRREQEGLLRLRRDADIVGYARRHCLRMIAVGNLYHDIPRYIVEVPGDLSDWENVGWMERTPGKPWGYTVRQLHRMFMKSPDHRANILRRGISHIGVGVQIVNGEMWVTENFARKT